MSNSRSHQLLEHLHRNTSISWIICSFSFKLWQSAKQSQVLNSLPRLCSERFFSTVFSAHFFCSALLHPRACAALCAYHSDQLRRTMHSIHPFVHSMLNICGFCCMPSQSQCSGSLLRVCLEASFGAQSRVVLVRRGCFQAPLSGCTILPIISCSSFGLFKEGKRTRVVINKHCLLIFLCKVTSERTHERTC